MLPITTRWQEILPQSTQTQVCLFIDTVGMVHCQHLQLHDAKTDGLICAGYTYKCSTHHIVNIIIIIIVICYEAIYF